MTIVIRFNDLLSASYNYYESEENEKVDCQRSGDYVNVISFGKARPEYSDL